MRLESLADGLVRVVGYDDVDEFVRLERKMNEAKPYVGINLVSRRLGN